MITPEQYHLIEPQYPSYIDTNHFGRCLRASHDLPAGTIVATADFEKTDKTFIANHPSPEHWYVALMHVAQDGTPTWGRIRGKWAFCNHSCDPAAILIPGFHVVTRRAVRAGEELTTAYDAYVARFAWQDDWTFDCLCTTSACKKVINGYRKDIVYPL